MKVHFYERVDDEELRFAVVVARHKGKWVLCKHRERDTYELPGGHREPGEQILDTARRELQEETGAMEFSLRPVCVYSVIGKNRVNQSGEECFGMLYEANIQTFQGELHSEMEQVLLLDQLPTRWTYPQIQPLLVEEYRRRRRLHLETPRLVIRNFIFQDAADLHEILGDAETMEYCEPPYDWEKTKQFLDSFCISRGGAVAAVHRECDKVIGYILFSEVQPGEYELGWFFHRQFWRQGYAYEACKAVMDHAFRTMRVEKIFAETIDRFKSVGLMQKLGMQLEEIQHEQDREWYVYELTRQRWEERMPMTGENRG